ncbi:MAG: HAD family hydrolase [Candidatus Brocadiaceae bacterium]|nr:HAD family hydrolase [Candidatus Brocadiaceae bacterium]
MIRAVIFDLDDTLFPESEYALSGFRAVGVWIEKKHSIHGFFPIAEEFFRKGKRGNIFNLALYELGIQYAEALVPEMVKVYREHRPDITLFEDARWALNYFKPNRKCGVVTDGYLVTQKNKIRALNIEDCFDIIIYSDEFGREHWKPSETPYRKVMESLSCSGNECVYIADNPVKDFVTAKALGWLTVHIRRPSGEYSHHIPVMGYEADKEITSLFELKELIE